MRLVGADGEQIGVVASTEALRMARDLDLDLVEVAPQANPPVCRIMDYGKFKYERDIRQKEARKKQARTELKEIKFRPKTEGHDMDFKVKHVRRFLEAGNKVRLAVVFRGREITHPQTGMNVLNRVVERCSDLATVEATPNMEGRRMIMVIAPRPGVVRKAQEAKKAAAAAQAAVLAQKKDQPGKPAPPTSEIDDEDDLDEDQINADVDDDDDDDEGEGEGDAPADKA